MSGRRRRLRLRLRDKILVTLVSLLAGLLALVLLVVNARISDEVHAGIARDLAAETQHLREITQMRDRAMLEAFRNLTREPRFRALVEAFDVGNLERYAQSTLIRTESDFVVFTGVGGRLLAFAGAADVGRSIRKDVEPAIGRALGGDELTGRITANGELYSVVAVPLLRSETEIVGALVVGRREGLALARDFGRITRSDLAVVVDGNVVATAAETGADLAPLLDVLASATRPVPGQGLGEPRPVSLGGERYVALPVLFDSPIAAAEDGPSGYVVFQSLDVAVAPLRRTQWVLVAIGLAALFVAAVVVTLLASTITRPLRALIEGTREVAAGNHRHRIPVPSRDEIGDLAAAFNEMTRRLDETHSRLVQADKMSALGRMAGALAHEIRSPLTAVIGFAEHLAMKVDEAHPLHRPVSLIEREALRCKDVITDLLSFSRTPGDLEGVVRVEEALGNIRHIVVALCKEKGIDLDVRAEERLPPIHGNRNLLQQVLVNLADNAVHAMERRGHLRLEARRAEFAPGRDGVEIRVRDDGAGIPAEHLPRLFEPFFTTKGAGEGTGLGLSLCYDIVTKHRGTIDVESEPGRGTTFVLRFPARAERIPVEA